METNLLPLYTQNPLGRFSNRAQEYANYRPSYPPEAIDIILAGLADPYQSIVADIGAGTGISSRLIADRGAMVWAIEPNAAMRDAATPHPRVRFYPHTAEQTRLPNAAVDRVTCCQSFHWFEPTATLLEFHRILKPTGRVALMWNDRNLNDPFTRAYSDLIAKFAERRVFDRPDRKSGTALETSSFFTNFRTHTLFHTHRLNLEGLIGLTLSASYMPKSGTAYEQLRVDVEQLYHQWTHPSDSDRVSLCYRVDLYVADRSPIA